MLTPKKMSLIRHGLRAALAGILSLAFLISSSAPFNIAAKQKPADTIPNPHIVQDINLDPLLASGSHFISIGDEFYFDVSANTCQLWKSDGSAAGTEQSVELSYMEAGSWGCIYPIVAGNLIYFMNSDPDHGYELWISDGTKSGTHLLKDIAPGPKNITLIQTLVVGDELFFYTHDYSTNGDALWKTDGSESGTIMVFNSTSTPVTGYDPQLKDVQRVVYFIGNDAAHGRELWKSDGTPQGTGLVKDIYPGSDGSYPYIQSIQGNTLYFSANDGVHGTELWKSDGSPSGTMLIKDINLGIGDSFFLLSPEQFTLYNGDLFFPADDGTHGRELWKTDGTSAGTEMVMDFSAGSASSAFPPMEILNDALIILVVEGNSSNYGLWRSDGSAAGTVLIKDLSGNLTHSPQMLGIANGQQFFVSAEGNVFQLFKTDGTPAATALVYQFSSEITYVSFSAELNGILYFDLGLSPQGVSLWRSDGTQAGTVPVLENERSMIPLSEWNGNLLYVRDFSDQQKELWLIDGSTQIPRLLMGAGPDQVNIVYPYFLDKGNEFYFLGYDPAHASALWRSDGTRAGTQPVRSLAGTANSYLEEFTPVSSGFYFKGVSNTSPASLINLYQVDRNGLVNLLLPASGNAIYARGLFELGENLFFVVDSDNPSHPAGLWRSDGTPGGTGLFLGQPYANGYISDLTRSGSQLFSIAHDYRDENSALWRTDGSAVGTWRVLDLSKVGHLKLVSDVNGTLFGIGYLKSGHDFLLVTDGTPAGTHYIHEFSDEVDPNLYLTWNGALYFQELNKLWVSDGTTDGTRILGQFGYQVSGNNLISSIRDFTGAGSQVFFTAKDDSHGVELWRTDGTPTGTLLVKDIYSGTLGSDPQPVASLGPLLYFTADDGLHGRELWRSDGTETGTHLVKDIRSGEESSYPSSFVVLHNTLYFSASDGLSGQELWRSDGSEAGTVLVKDILPGAGGSAPKLSVQAGSLYLAANDGVHGIEPWISDGTESGTFLMSDANPGSSSSQPEQFTYWRGQVFFEAGDFEHGRELWVYDLGLTVRSYMPLLTR
jgi:ELWxxDGT repeat protein